MIYTNLLKFSDNDLQEELDSLLYDFDYDPSQSKSNKISVIQNEIHRRTMKKLDSTLELNIEATKGLIKKQESYQKEAKKWSRATILLSFIMIILAGITIYFAFNDLKTDAKWIDNQEKLLISIDSSINNSNKILFQILDTNKKKVQDLSPEP